MQSHVNSFPLCTTGVLPCAGRSVSLCLCRCEEQSVECLRTPSDCLEVSWMSLRWFAEFPQKVRQSTIGRTRWTKRTSSMITVTMIGHAVRTTGTSLCAIQLGALQEVSRYFSKCARQVYAQRLVGRYSIMLSLQLAATPTV